MPAASHDSGVTTSRGVRALLITVLVCTNLLVLVLCGYSLLQSRRQYDQRAEVQIQNIAGAVDQNIAISIEKITLVLRAAADELERQLAARQGLDEEGVQLFLARLERRLPEVDAFRVADANGLVIFGKGLNKRDRVSWADRDYFLFHRDHSDSGLLISKPLMGRVAKKHIITISVRYNTPDGRFAGVIAAPVGVDHFARILSRYDLGPHGVIVLRDIDGGLIARAPPLADQPSGLVGSAPNFPQLLQRIATGVRSDTGTTQVGPDGYLRMLAYLRLDKAPMIVVAGVAGEDYLADWRGELYKTAGGALGFVLLSLLTGGFLSRLLTQAARRERRLRQSEAGLNYAQRVAHLGSFDWDRAGGKLRWSDEHYRLWGLEPHSVEPSRALFWRAIHPDDVARTEAALRLALRDGGTYTCEYRLLRRDGGERHILAGGAVSLDAAGRAQRVMGTVQDITGRKQAEEGRREALDRLQKIASRLPGVVFQFRRCADGRSCVPYASDTLNTLYRLGPDAVRDDASPVFARVHPDDLRDHLDSIAVSGRDLTPWHNEYRLKFDGEPDLWLLGNATPEREADGSILWHGFISDITRRKQDEAEVLRSNRELEQFSYSISHDMRQPLRMISSYLQLLEKSLADRLDADQRTYFDFAVDGAKRMDSMMLGLLEYSRIGRKGEPSAWTDSRALLDEALRFLQPAIAEARAGMRVEGDWPRIFISPDEMLRLLQNLIGNALKFRLAARAPEIVARSECLGQTWRVSVADNGIGIAPDQIERLFQMFQRLQPRTAYQGTGIGLALCRKIAEHHAGRIWVESEGEGLGSRFIFEMPLSAAAHPLQEGAPSALGEPA